MTEQQPKDTRLPAAGARQSERHWAGGGQEGDPPGQNRDRWIWGCPGSSPGQKTEACKGMIGGATARGRAPRAAPSLSSRPAEPSPVLMMAERARGRKSEPAPVEAVTQRPAGSGRPTTAGSGPRGRGCSFDPKTALLGSRCREPRSSPEGGARAHRARPAAARCPFEQEKEAEPATHCDSLRAGRAWEAARPGRRTKRPPRKRTARPGDPRPPPPAAAPAPDPAPAAESESLMKTTRHPATQLLLFCSLRSCSWCGQRGWNLCLLNRALHPAQL